MSLNLFRHLKAQGIEPGHRYKATVIDNKDPLMIGRIKARVQHLMDGIDDADLPWASPLFIHFGAAIASDTCNTGSFSVPYVNSVVFLTWQSPDPHNPFYTSYTVDTLTSIGLAEEDYPDTHIIYTFPDCSVLLINVKRHELYLYNAGSVNVRLDGDTKATVKGNVDLHVAGDTVSDVLGNTTINIKAAGQREREACGCVAGRADTTYSGGGTGILTVNVEQDAIINCAQNLTANVKQSSYLNVERDVQVSAGNNARVTVKGATDIHTTGTTKVYGAKEVNVKCDDKLVIGATEIHMKSDKFLLESDSVDVKCNNKAIIDVQDLHVIASNIVGHIKERLDYVAQHIVGRTDKSEFTGKKSNIKCDELLIKNAQITGIISAAVTVKDDKIKEPETTDPNTVDDVTKPVEPKLSDKAVKGPRADGGPTGWFVKLAEIVRLKRKQKTKKACE